MICQPPNPESIHDLRSLQHKVSTRGDECLALLLAGVEAYVALGREWELLDVMRTFAHESKEMVENTPTAEQLRRLFEQE